MIKMQSIFCLTIFCFVILIDRITAENCFSTQVDLANYKLLCFNTKENGTSFNSTVISNVTQILIFKGEMQSVQPIFFQNFNSSKMQMITLTRGNLSSVDENSFSSLSELLYLNLSFNKIANISEKAFDNNYKLKSISLMSNEIRELKRNTFSTLIDLESIDLSRNYLRKIDKHLFSDNKKLLYIDLKFNRLSDISGVIFHGLPILSVLDLSFNQIEIIPPHTFKYNYALKEINLQENKIRKLDFGLTHLGLERINLLGNPLDMKNKRTEEVLVELARSRVNVKMKDIEQRNKQDPTPKTFDVSQNNTEQMIFKLSPTVQFVMGGILVLLVIILILLSVLLYHVYLRKNQKVFKRYYPHKQGSKECLNCEEESNLHLNMSNGSVSYRNSEEDSNDDHETTCGCSKCCSKTENNVDT